MEKVLTLVMAALLGLSTFPLALGYQSPQASLRVQPSIVEFWTPAYGKTFSVNVTLENVTDLYGYEFKLLWNTTLLDCIGVNVTPPAEWGTNYFIAKNESDEALGRYWLAVSLLPRPSHLMEALFYAL
jgi:hypothetical protein